MLLRTAARSAASTGVTPIPPATPRIQGDEVNVDMGLPYGPSIRTRKGSCGIPLEIEIDDKEDVVCVYGDDGNENQ